MDESRDARQRNHSVAERTGHALVDLGDDHARVGGGGLGGGGLGSKIKPKAAWKVILLFSGFFAVVFGLMLASRYFGFALFFDLKMSDPTLIKLTSIVAIISGAFTLFREIKGYGGSGGLGDLGAGLGGV